MKRLKFPYLKYRVTPPAQKAARYVYRPVISLTLFSGSNEVTFDALIDSGADECIFPGWIANSLGYNIYKGKQKIFSGIGGSVLAYLHKTHLQLNDVKFAVDVYYSHEWDDMPFGLLGQAGFFAHFDIRFNYKEKFILLKH